MIGSGELLFLAGLVFLLYWVLLPLRRWLEARFARRLARRSGADSRRARVVVLERRRDGTFGREDRRDG